YDRTDSAPFRDINHEPELMLAFDTAGALGTWIMRQVDFGLVHQSNGASFPYSRSWNTVYARFLADLDRFEVALKPWLRLPDAPANDDNEDILEYMGHGELTVSYARKNHVLAATVRNNLRLGNNKGALRVDYDFPLTHQLTG